jgi:ethanolamine transporter EutH
VLLLRARKMISSFMCHFPDYALLFAFSGLLGSVLVCHSECQVCRWYFCGSVVCRSEMVLASVVLMSVLVLVVLWFQTERIIQLVRHITCYYLSWVLCYAQS